MPLLPIEYRFKSRSQPYIDGGFGTLDSEALRKAYLALDDLTEVTWM